MEKLSVKNSPASAKEIKKIVSWFDLRKFAEMLFFAALIVILLVDYVSATYVSLIISGRMQQLAIILLAGKILLTRYSKKEWIVVGVLFILSVISFWQTKNYYACELFMLVIASKGIELRKAVKIYLIVVGVITFMAAAASILGIFGEVSQLANFRGERGAEAELRYCFGYNHPNVCHIVFLQLALAFVWLCYNKLKWYVLVLIASANIILGIFTDSRTGMILGTVVFLFLAVAKKWPVIQEVAIIYWLNIVALLGAVVLSVLAVVVGVQNPVLEFVSRLWTGRILYAYMGARESRLSLFSGTELQISCDMGLVKLCYNYGIVIFAIFMLLVVGKLLLNKKRKDIVELMVLLSGLFFLLGETFSSGEFITRNILVVFMIGMWSGIWNTKESVSTCTKE